MTVPHEAGFAPGAMVLVSLANPREKFWGMLLELAPAGVSVRGIDLNSFEDFISLVKAGEAASAAAVFFPMHRLERMELDTPNGDLPSLSQRFEASSGRPASALLSEDRQRRVPLR